MPNLELKSLTQAEIWMAQNDAAVTAEMLVSQYGAYVRRLALSILDDPAEADDITQETLIAACSGLSTFRGQADLRTWVASIVINKSRSHLRRRKARQFLQNTLESLHLLGEQSLSPEQAVVRSQADRQLWQAVDALGEKHRLPVILRYVHQLSVPEIAGILEISEGTVHSRLHYARQRLQEQLGSDLTPEEVFR